MTQYGKDLGIGWARLPVDIDSENYRGVEIDPVVKEYQNNGILGFGVINPGARRGEEFFPTADQFAQAVARLVERYDGDGVDDMPGLIYPVKVWELTNEYSSTGMSKQYPEGFDQATYIEMMKRGYHAMKQACSDCLFAFNPFDEDDAKALLKEFSKDNIDIISYHSYNPLDYVDNAAIDLYIGNIETRMSKFGLEEKEIWLTEYDFNAHKGAEPGIGVFPGSQTDNARWFVQTTGWGFGTGAFEKIIYSEIETPKDAGDEPSLAWMALVDSEGTKRPIYYAFQKMIQMIDMFDSREELSLGNNIYCYRFNKGTESTYLIWSRETTGEKNVTITDITEGTARITTSVPDSGGNFNSETVIVTETPLTLTVNETPLYIEFAEKKPEEPVIETNPSEVVFDKTEIGYTSATESIIISNIGTGMLDISSVLIDPDIENSFKIETDGCSGTSLPSGSSCTITINFSPVTAGQKTSMLIVSSNDPETPTLEIEITGEGIESSVVCAVKEILGNDDPRLTKLRFFRDSVLSKSGLGRYFVRTYYGYGEQIIGFLNKHLWLKYPVEAILKTIPASQLR